MARKSKADKEVKFSGAVHPQHPKKPIKSILMKSKVLLFVLSAVPAILYYFYITPGSHQVYVQHAEKTIIWYAWWVFLGVLSSIGFGTGLHTFLIYLGPHIAAVTLAAYECSSVDFPEPPYPESIICPSAAKPAEITMWTIVAKALLWGAGTALGELPPYFMARAARLSGNEPDDEDYVKFKQLMNKGQTQGLMLFVILAFSEHHVDYVLQMLAKIPSAGQMLQAPIKAFLNQQRVALHRAPGSAHVEPEANFVQTALSLIVTGMIAVFCLSIFNSLAQSYHRRIHH